MRPRDRQPAEAEAVEVRIPGAVCLRCIVAALVCREVWSAFTAVCPNTDAPPPPATLLRPCPRRGIRGGAHARSRASVLAGASTGRRRCAADLKAVLVACAGAAAFAAAGTAWAIAVELSAAAVLIALSALSLLSARALRLEALDLIMRGGEHLHSRRSRVNAAACSKCAPADVSPRASTSTSAARHGRRALPGAPTSPSRTCSQRALSALSSSGRPN